MRTETFTPKGKGVKDQQVDEHSRLTVNGVEPVAVYQVDDQGKRIKLLKKGVDFKIKLHDIDAIDIDSKDGFNWVLEGPDPIDTTPLEVPVEKPLTQTQQLRMWLQNEENVRQSKETELKWEDFKDLGEMDNADEFFTQFGQEGMTKYEMQAEALRQHANPMRGMDLNEIQSDGSNGAETTQVQQITGDSQDTGADDSSAPTEVPKES